MPDVGIQIPPNLADWWDELVEAGATDLGGLSANGDHISPEHPFPSPHQVRKRLAPRGYALTERLCVYPQYLDPEWIEQGVLDVVKLKYWSFIPRRGSGRRAERRDRPGARPGGDREGPQGRGAHRRGADRAVRRDPARGDRVDAGRRRRAARRARRRDRDLRRQPQHQLHQRLHRRLRLLRLRPGPALARRLRRRARTTSRRGSTRRSSSGRPRSACRAASTPTTRSSTTGAGCGSPSRSRRRSTSTPTRRWRSTTCASARASRPTQVFEYLLECGLGSTPGTAAEVLDDGVRARISPNKLPAARWVEIIEASHRAGLALDLDRDVRPHRGALGAGRAHARDPRRCRSGPAGSPSSSRSASSPSRRCSAAPTGSRRSRPRRTSSTPPPSGSRSAARSATCRRAG